MRVLELFSFATLAIATQFNPNTAPPDWVPHDMEFEEGDFIKTITAYEAQKESARADALLFGIKSNEPSGATDDQEDEDEFAGKRNIVAPSTREYKLDIESTEEDNADDVDYDIARPSWAGAMDLNYMQLSSQGIFDSLGGIFKQKNNTVAKKPPNTVLKEHKEPEFDNYVNRTEVRMNSVIRMRSRTEFIPVPAKTKDIAKLAQQSKEDYLLLPGVRIDCEENLKVIDANPKKWWWDQECKERCNKFKDCDLYVRDGWGESSFICEGKEWMSYLRPADGWQVGVRGDLFQVMKGDEEFVVLLNHQLVCPNATIGGDFSKKKYFESLVNTCKDMQHPMNVPCIGVTMRVAASPVGHPRDAEELIPHHLFCTNGPANMLRYKPGHVTALRLQDTPPQKLLYEMAQPIPRAGKERIPSGFGMGKIDRVGMVSDVTGEVHNPHQQRTILVDLGDVAADRASAKQQAQKAALKEHAAAIEQAAQQAAEMLAASQTDMERRNKSAKQKEVSQGRNVRGKSF